MRLALTGDSILQRRLLSRSDPAVRPVFDLLHDADLAFTNLEVLPNDYRGDPAQESGGSHFGAPSWVLDELSEAGFDLFAFATNHVLDYGVAGVLASLEALERRGVTHAGVGRHLEDARRPAYHPHPGGTVALLSCCSTYARGQQAAAQTRDMPGRPGLAPLGYDTVYEVTEAQLGALRDVAAATGLEALRQQMLQTGFKHPPDDPAIVPFGEMHFRAAAEAGIRTTAKPRDVDAIAHWVREARGLADLVLVSVHAHEQGADKETPAEFLPPFARRMIDEGADLVVGHGPHLLRGIEMHGGKPIFYSLGNFLGQNELVPRIPADSYERFRASADLKPGEVYRVRTDNDRKGFPADPRFWESVVAVCTFEDGALTELALHPLDLQHGERAHVRGRPRLAEGAKAAAILDRLAALSAPFGTTIAREDTARVVLASGAPARQQAAD
ncbi:MAG: CapA family protein [Acetobacteraceae bacterium]|nr:CapA family protein [Acetobacteraceae bacterium]